MAYQDGDAIDVIYVPRECIQKAKLFLNLKKKGLVSRSSSSPNREIALGFGVKNCKAYFYVHDYSVLYYKELYEVPADTKNYHAVCKRKDVVKSLVKRDATCTAIGVRTTAGGRFVDVYVPPDVLGPVAWEVSPTVNSVVDSIRDQKGLACEFDVRRITLATKLMEPACPVPTTVLQIVHADQNTPTGFLKVDEASEPGNLIEISAIASITKNTMEDSMRVEILDYLRNRDIRIAMDENCAEMDSVEFLVSKTHGEVLRRIYKELKSYDGKADSV